MDRLEIKQEFIRDYYKLSVKELMEKYHVSRTTIWKKAKELRLKPKNKSKLKF